MRNVRFIRYGQGALLSTRAGRVNLSIAASRKGRVALAATCNDRPNLRVWSGGR